MSGGFLVDSSVWQRATHDLVRDRLDELPAALYTCVVVALEWGLSARNQREYDRRMGQLAGSVTGSVAVTVDVEARALAVQRLLVPGGVHRAARLPDLLIAATAEHHGLTVLHYDSDFDLIAKVTGQPCEWVVKRGSIS